MTTIDAYPGTGIFPAKAKIISLNPHIKLNRDVINPKDVTNWVNLELNPNKISIAEFKLL